MQFGSTCYDPMYDNGRKKFAKRWLFPLEDLVVPVTERLPVLGIEQPGGVLIDLGLRFRQRSLITRPQHDERGPLAGLVAQVIVVLDLPVEPNVEGDVRSTDDQFV